MSAFLATAAALVLAQADAGDAPAPAPGFLDNFGTLLPLVLMFGVIYMLLIRPANKQRREHAALLTQLKKDDEVVTNSGMYGRIVSLDDKVATLEIADKVKIRILRDRIAGRWNPVASQKDPAAR
jgi:preprotein translocase subunit YajC